MASTTPTTAHHTRTTSRNALPPPHPTTPLRPPSRTSLRESSHKHTSNQQSGSSPTSHPLDALEPAFAELSDSMADLEANFMHLQLLHESLSRFSENFAGFLYGLNMNAFCVDFPEAPVAESFRSARREEESYGARASAEGGGGGGAQQRFGREEDGSNDPDATFLTTDTSFVENPPTSSKPASKFSAPPAPGSRIASAGRGAPRGGTGRGGGAARGTRGSGLARARGRGIK